MQKDSNNSPQFSKKEIRTKICKVLHDLPFYEQRKKSEALLQNNDLRSELLKSQHIAAYWPIKGEFDPRPLIHLANQTKKHCYLPVLHPLSHHQLLFMKYTPNMPLVINRFGVYEPKLNTRNLILPWMLNLVLVPLLAFDKQGVRLGRGKGYYDRTFSFIKTKEKPFHPRLIGLAYDFQYYDSLPSQDWDVGLSGVATETQFYHFTKE